VIGSADQAWRWYLRGCRAAQAAAVQLQRGLLEKLGERGLLTERVLAPLTAALILVGVIGFWLGLTIDIGAPSLAGAADPVVVFKSPQNPTLWLCRKGVASCKGEGQGHLTINEEVSGIPSGVGLGSFEFLIYYWGNIVNVSVTEGPFLGSTGRSVLCPTPIAGENSLPFGCASTGSEPGPSGSGVLAHIEMDPDPDLVLRPTARNGFFVNLLNSRLDAGLADEMGKPIPIEAVGSARILVQALEGDLNYDCKVNVIDEQAVSGRYGTTFGIQPYDTFFDLEPISPDFDIDIKDLQFVYGRDGTSCEEPVPPVPTSTPTPVPPVPTSTPTPVPPVPTSTPTPVPPGTATPTPSAGTPSPTASPTPTAGTPLPSATPLPPGRPKTPTPTAGSPTPGGSPTPETVAPARVGTLTPTPTPTPEGGIAPTERTPGPGGEIAPEGQVPGAAEGLPRAGVGPYEGSSDGYLALLIAMLAMGGWSILAGMLYCRETQLSEQPVEAERTRRRPARRSERERAS